MPVGDAPTTLRGSLSGGWRFGQYTGWWADVLEYVPDLTWPTSVWTYARMRHDPTLQSVLAGYIDPLLRASWALDPASATDALTRDCADGLGIPILGQDQDQGAMRSRGVQWVEHVRLAALQLVFGHMAFEPVYDVGTGRAVLRALPERMPQTISNIAVDGDGNLQGIAQSATPEAAMTGQVELTYDNDPARSQLLWYARHKEGAAWQGQSIFRACFGPWLIKQDIIRAHATGIRRFGAGTPVMEPIVGYSPTPTEVAEAQRLAQAVRVGETGGATTKGFTLHIKGVEGSLPDAMPFLRYLDEQMARSALTSALDLGSTPNGSRALGLAFLDVMAMAQQSFAERVAATAGRLCVAMAEYNEGPGAPAPVIVVGDVASSERIMADSVAQLVQAGALVMDDELQSWLRQMLKLPQMKTPITPVRTGGGGALGLANIGRPAGNAGGAGGAVAATAGGGRPSARTSGRQRLGPDWPYRRQLTTVEARAGIDPVSIDDEVARIMGDLMQQWPKVSRAWRAQLQQQIAEALASEDPGALTTLAVDATQAGNTLHAAILDAAAVGVASAVEEADSQGVRLAGQTPDDDTLVSQAHTLAAIMAMSYAATAAREAFRLWDTRRDAADVAADVGNHLAGLSDTTLRDTFNGAVNGGVNGGRQSAMATAEVPVRFYASEIRDSNTCENCTAIDGQEFASQDEADASYPTGGYIDCLGRYRCRGIVIAVYGDDQEEA